MAGRGEAAVEAVAVAGSTGEGHPAAAGAGEVEEPRGAYTAEGRYHRTTKRKAWLQQKGLKRFATEEERREAKQRKREGFAKAPWRAVFEKYFHVDEEEAARSRTKGFCGARAEFQFELAKDIVGRALKELEASQDAAAAAAAPPPPAAAAEGAGEVDAGADARVHAGYWDEFYEEKSERFFQQRHWLRKEYPILAPETDHPAPGVCLELGCGTGSTVYPLLSWFPACRVYCCDLSATAIRLLKGHAAYDPDRITAFVSDIGSPASNLPATVPPGSVDVTTLLFVLSAMLPAQMAVAVRHLFRAVKPGGHVCFRDYGVYDMTQLRFVAKGGRRIAPNLYARADGTRTYFFDKDWAADLFRAAGFEIRQCVYITTELRNRKKKLNMRRVFVQALLRRPHQGDAGAAGDVAGGAEAGAGELVCGS